MTTFMTNLQTFFTAFLSMMGDVVTFISDNPIILIAVMIAVAGIVVGLVKRFVPGL
jgi:hypothetical protein